MANLFDNKPNTLARIDLMMPVPASTARAVQPVVEIAKKLGKKLKKQVDIDAMRKTRKTPRLKDVQDPEERARASPGTVLSCGFCSNA